MSYEGNVVPIRRPLPKTPTQESLCCSRSVSINADTESQQASLNQIGSVHEPLAILWDIENCPVPSDVRPEDVAGNIRLALRMHPTVNGSVTLFSAYGDFNAFPRRLREGCQRTGVKLVDVPNGRKDAADKAILVDMFLFALDNRPPSSILLISGDVDFSAALHILGQRGYTVILVIPSGVGVLSALTNAGRFVWDWSTVARGKGFVPPTYMSYMPRSPDNEEAIVYRGISPSSQMYCYDSVPSSSQTPPSGPAEAPASDLNALQDCWIQPGDIQGLKGRLVRILAAYGGSLPLVRVPGEYLRSFGRPLYMSEFGVCKLVNLIQKMEDTLVVTGSGTRKQLCLRSDYANFKCQSSRDTVKGKETCEESVDIGICSSDDLSDEENERLDGFKREVQELLVCYSCLVPLTSFESLYKQRYKKALDFGSFGADGLEELMEKVCDVALIREDKGSKMKFLLSS